MELPTKMGLNAEGYIINPTAKENVQKQFKPVINAVIDLLRQLLKENLHSIYVYGSIGRGEAK
ncbi:hypothetical protein [Bacillus sp. 2205SS5-2]|uniref:hypothetical protein n=1 Tax=Bacillus sp. 2205SS5-2 TaxID=3109031 RepID=UPI003007D5AC